MVYDLSGIGDACQCVGIIYARIFFFSFSTTPQKRWIRREKCIKYTCIKLQLQRDDKKEKKIKINFLKIHIKHSRFGCFNLQIKGKKYHKIEHFLFTKLLLKTSISMKLFCPTDRFSSPFAVSQYLLNSQ